MKASGLGLSMALSTWSRTLHSPFCARCSSLLDSPTPELEFPAGLSSLGELLSLLSLALLPDAEESLALVASDLDVACLDDSALAGFFGGSAFDGVFEVWLASGFGGAVRTGR